MDPLSAIVVFGLAMSAVDLVPEFKKSEDGKPHFRHTFWWLLGLCLLLAVRLLGHE